MSRKKPKPLEDEPTVLGEAETDEPAVEEFEPPHRGRLLYQYDRDLEAAMQGKQSSGLAMFETQCREAWRRLNGLEPEGKELRVIICGERPVFELVDKS